MKEANPAQGVLVVFEGISGSGKSDGICKLMRELTDSGAEPLLYEWNANPFIRRLTRIFAALRLLGANTYSLLQWLGFLIDYRKVIAPALRHNRIVIADRYFFTGLTRDEVNGAWRGLGRWISRRVRQPDYVYYFDTPVSLCHERILARGKPLFYPSKRIRRMTHIENKDLHYLELMDSAYKRLLKTGRARHIHVISHRQSVHLNEQLKGLLLSVS